MAQVAKGNKDSCKKTTPAIWSHSKQILIQILRASNAKAVFNQAARTLRCEGCDAVHPEPQTQKVAFPRSLSFNDPVGVDIFEVKDANGERYSEFSMVDQGTCFHQAAVVKVGGSQATSRECLKVFQSSRIQA